MKIFVLIISLVCLTASTVYSATRRVPSEYTTIQEAIDVSNDGDSIVVAAGIYGIPASNLRIARISSKTDLTLMGECGKESTFLDGTGSDGDNPDIILIEDSQGCRISGFTIQNACRRNIMVDQFCSDISITDCNISDSGNGISFHVGTNGKVMNCNIFSHHTGVNAQGNVEVTQNNIHDNYYGIHGIGSANIQYNIIFGNEYGVWIGGTGSYLITYNQIFSNSADGIVIEDYYVEPPYIANNTVAFNAGKGLWIRRGSPTIHVNVIANNEGAGIAVDVYANPYVTCNDVWSNSHFENGNYIGYITDQTGFNGNISEDPFFCNPALYDYSLASNSTALLATCGVMGAISTPGCGPHTAVVQSTWGSIKAMYK